MRKAGLEPVTGCGQRDVLAGDPLPGRRLRRDPACVALHFAPLRVRGLGVGCSVAPSLFPC